MVQLLRVEQAASLLRVSRSEIYKLVSEHRLGCVRVGARILVSEQQVEDFVEACTMAAEAEL